MSMHMSLSLQAPTTELQLPNAEHPAGKSPVGGAVSPVDSAGWQTSSLVPTASLAMLPLPLCQSLPRQLSIYSRQLTCYIYITPGACCYPTDIYKIVIWEWQSFLKRQPAKSWHTTLLSPLLSSSHLSSQLLLSSIWHCCRSCCARGFKKNKMTLPCVLYRSINEDQKFLSCNSKELISLRYSTVPHL